MRKSKARRMQAIACVTVMMCSKCLSKLINPFGVMTRRVICSGVGCCAAMMPTSVDAVLCRMTMSRCEKCAHYCVRWVRNDADIDNSLYL